MKATKQYFPVVLCIMLYKVVLTFESVDVILKCDHSNENKIFSSSFIPFDKIIPFVFEQSHCKLTLVETHYYLQLETFHL